VSVRLGVLFAVCCIAQGIQRIGVGRAGCAVDRFACFLERTIAWLLLALRRFLERAVDALAGLLGAVLCARREPGESGGDANADPRLQHE
jgi:hypothetical protein